MIWLSRYHVVIDCQNKKVIFRIPHQPESQFNGEHKSAKEKTQSVCTIAEVRRRRREYQFGMSSWMYLKRFQDFHPAEQLSFP